ncbi:MAG: phosphoglycerate kinase [Candidatus Moranbacteria bacterium]|nr:phosphoglycerate kinase [Candidatus Moranbacteria bacterium]
MNQARSAEDFDFSGKKVLVRVDFNVELNNKQEVQEQFKLEAPRKTLDRIRSFSGVKIALISHFGRPEGKKDEAFSLRQVVPAVERALDIKIRFVDDCIGSSVIDGLETMSSDEILLLENVRFYPGEEADDPAFATELASPFDVYVNEAFSVCHRNQASVSAITRILPSLAGPRLLEEAAMLDRIKDDPARPAIAIIGGAKIETKLPLIREFERIYDAVLVGGKIANEAADQEIQFSDKVLLPKDFQGGENRLDIGPATTAMFIEVIRHARTIVWNGPLGKFEEKPYDAGTDAILHAISESGAQVVIGGGESLAVLEREGLIDKIGFVCTGGGAMLEYMSGNTLPGLVALGEAGEAK